MYIPATVQCDVCKIVHTEVNGWYTVILAQGPVKAIQILPYQSKYEREPAVCGAECLHTFINRNIDALKE